MAGDMEAVKGVYMRIIDDLYQSISLLGQLIGGWRGGLVVGRRTCDLVVAGSRPGRDAAA